MVLSKDEIRKGLLEGRRLIQEEWADPGDIKVIDELVQEGVAKATPWRYKPHFQCEMREITKK